MFHNDAHVQRMGFCSSASMIDDATFADILAQLIAGEAVRRVLKDKGVLPGIFYPMLDKDKARAEQYARALASGHDAFADAIVETSCDEGLPADSRRIRVDAAKWILARRSPKKYGDKTILSSDPDNPIPPLVIIGPSGSGKD